MHPNRSVSYLSSLDDLSPTKNKFNDLFGFLDRDAGFEDFERFKDFDLAQKLQDYISRVDISDKDKADAESMIIRYIEYLEIKNVQLTNNQMID